VLKNGEYTVRGVLGEGGQGTTFDAVDRSGKAFAIKRFDVRGARGWKDVELAEREARVLATLDHPLLPRYIEHFEGDGDGALYLVMEKIEGETLEALCKREGALTEDEVRRFLADADRTLTYLHGRAAPIVHRDIKPRNVVRRPDGSYVIVDFGAVSELLHRRGGASTIVGTLGFMAPEQLQGRALPATDIYAVGATALAALSGREPETLPHRGLAIDVRAALAGRVSRALIESLEQMLEPDPDRRVATLRGPLERLSIGDDARAGGQGRSESVRGAALASVPAASGEKNSSEPAPSEDALVKSLMKLLWVLWGLGWVLVPVLFASLGIRRLVPAVMFGALGLLVIATWSKGLLLRALLRHFRAVEKLDNLGLAPAEKNALKDKGRSREASRPQLSPASRGSERPAHQVRIAPPSVGLSNPQSPEGVLRDDEVLGHTEREPPPQARRG